MKAVVQRVKNATVVVENRTVGHIMSGLLVYYGVEVGDDIAFCSRLAEKILSLRIFRDEKDKMNLSLKDVEGELLVVSQFTLAGDCWRGNRPSFDRAKKGSEANLFYERFCAEFEARGFHVEKGIFGAHMEVSYLNDGPVTFILDSGDLEKKK
jgi:D-tyrosyl-tRNA(Tyr) deacylase